MSTILALVANFFLLLVDWYRHKSVLTDTLSPLGSSKATAETMTFFISISSVRIEPAMTEMDTSDFLSQCEGVSATEESGIAATCEVVQNMSNCFTAYLVFMAF